MERYVGQKVDHVVPWDKKFVLAANVGQPLLMSKLRWNKSAKALAQIVDSIEEDAERRKSSGYDVNDGQPLEARDAPDFDQLPTANGLEGA